jgi:hypothetical protein
LADKYDYDNHPFEIEAKRVASRDSKRCERDLKLFFW